MAREGLLTGNCREEAKADLNFSQWVEATLRDREGGRKERSCGQTCSDVAGFGVLMRTEEERGLGSQRQWSHHGGPLDVTFGI